MKTRAAVLVEQHAPLELVELEVPAPSFGQVLVRVLYSGVCGSQIGEIDGRKGPDRWLPHLLGHEATGVVTAVGPAVTTVTAGDRVVLHWRPGAGLQATTPSYRWGGRTVNAGWVTTFQDHTVVAENRVTKIPAEVDPALGVLYGCALTTAFGVVGRDAAVRVGQSVVVFGAGGVGASVVQAAHLAGAHPIVAVDLQAHKLELAQRLGATHAILSAGDDVEEKIRAIVGGGGSDVVIESTGVPAVMGLAQDLTSAQGKTILVGVPPHGERVPVATLPLHFGKVLSGSHGGDAEPAYDIPRLIRLQEAGRLELEPLVSHRFDLSEVNEAIARMRSGEALRCVLRCSGE